MKKTAVMMMLAVFLAVSTASYAKENMKEPPGPSGEAMVFDIILARPLGLVTLVAGSAIFIVGLPFTIPTGSVKSSARKLVADPFEFTFMRPVGEPFDETYSPDR